jgi:hypothetical protein
VIAYTAPGKPHMGVYSSYTFQLPFSLRFSIPFAPWSIFRSSKKHSV